MALSPSREIRESGHVASGASQTAHQPRPDRIARADHDDGDRLRRLHQRFDRCIARGRDDIHLETSQLRRQRAKPSKLASAIRDSMTRFFPST